MQYCAGAGGSFLKSSNRYRIFNARSTARFQLGFLGFRIGQSTGTGDSKGFRIGHVCTVFSGPGGGPFGDSNRNRIASLAGDFFLFCVSCIRLLIPFRTLALGPTTMDQGGRWPVPILQASQTDDQILLDLTNIPRGLSQFGSSAPNAAVQQGMISQLVQTISNSWYTVDQAQNLHAGIIQSGQFSLQQQDQFKAMLQSRVVRNNVTMNPVFPAVIHGPTPIAGGGMMPPPNQLETMQPKKVAVPAQVKKTGRFSNDEVEAIIDLVGPFRQKNQSSGLNWESVTNAMSVNLGIGTRDADSVHDKWDKLLAAYRVVANYHRTSSGKNSFFDLSFDEQKSCFAAKTCGGITPQQYEKMHQYLQADRSVWPEETIGLGAAQIEVSDSYIHTIVLHSVRSIRSVLCHTYSVSILLGTCFRYAISHCYYGRSRGHGDTGSAKGSNADPSWSRYTCNGSAHSGSAYSHCPNRILSRTHGCT